MPVTSRGVSSRERSASSNPSKLSSMPRQVIPALNADLTTARMTALRPGASPPLVRMPMRLTDVMRSTIAKGCQTGDDVEDFLLCDVQNWRVRLAVRFTLRGGG